MNIKQIKNRLTNSTIIQFSPPRSGSTLVYNILKDVFPRKHIKKRHLRKATDTGLLIVATYRHPLDCIASLIQCYGLTPTDDVIQRLISETEAIWNILAIKNNPRVLLLRYEDFVYDFEVVFSGVEKFFRIKIPDENRKFIAECYRIESVEKIAQRMGDFSEYDQHTLWHGKHISAYKGRPLYYKEFFTQDQVTYLEKIYADFLVSFNYRASD